MHTVNVGEYFAMVFACVCVYASVLSFGQRVSGELLLAEYGGRRSMRWSVENSKKMMMLLPAAVVA